MRRLLPSLLSSWRLRDTIVVLIGALVLIVTVVIINEVPQAQATKYLAFFLLGVAGITAAVGNTLQRRK